MNMNDRDREKVKQLLTDAVTLLCKSSLHFEEEVAVEGLIGITLDKKDIILVSIRETLQQTFCRVSDSRNLSIESNEDSPPNSPKRRKRHHSSGSSESMTSVEDSEIDGNNYEPAKANMDNEKALNMVKKEMGEDEKKEEDSNVNTEEDSGKDSPVTVKKEITDDGDCCVVGEETSPTQPFPVIDWPAAAAAVFDSTAEGILPGTSYHSQIAYFLQSKVTGSLGTGGPVFPTLEINPTLQQRPQHSSPASSSIAEVEENKSAGPAPARKWYRCAFCGVGYNWKQSYQRHLLLKHLGQGYMCPLCSRRFARKDHLQRHYYNCKRRYGVSNNDDSVYVTAMVQAGMVNNGSSSSSQGQAGDTVDTFNSQVPIHRGRGRPRGSRNKILGMALDGQALNSQAMSSHALNSHAMNSQAMNSQAMNSQAIMSHLGLNNQAMNNQLLNNQAMNNQVLNNEANNEAVNDASVNNESVCKESVNNEGDKVMPVNNNNNNTNSAGEESQAVVFGNQEKGSEKSSLLSNDQAVLLPIYRAAKISSQVANEVANEVANQVANLVEENHESKSESQGEPSSN